MYKPYRLLSMLLTLTLTLLLTAAPATASATEALTLSETIAAVAATSKPSVVGILTTMRASSGTWRGRSAGTGFVYKSGVIITNAHVVDGASELRILYHDETVETVSPSQVFSDAKSDIAVIKVQRADLPTVTFADTDQVRVGDQVLAIGNPLGFRLGNSVSFGIVSGLGRALGTGYPFIQTDAAINPGNSGGPLFNLKGEVVGINSAKMASIGVEGLGFAIPGSVAIDMAEQLLEHGRIERATMGIEFQDSWQSYFGVPDPEGMAIAYVIPDGPAGLTALRYGDKLIKLDTTAIETADDIATFLSTKKPGDKVTLTVTRRGQVLTVTITLGSEDELRQMAEQDAAEEYSGIMIDLTAGQIQEAVEFGKDIAIGWAYVDPNYMAMSGSSYAVLYTEYLYIARRVSSAYDFGFTPSTGFYQQVAKEINTKLHFDLELMGDRANFLSGATYTLRQGTTVVSGAIHAGPVYTSAVDGSSHTANVALRFSSATLNSTDDLHLTVRLRDGRSYTFNFTIAELR